MWLRWVYVNQNSLYINPEEIQNPDEIAQKLYSLVWMEKPDLLEMIKKRPLKYVPIITKMAIWLSEEINTYIDSEKQSIKKSIFSEDSSISNFFILDSNNKRYFPENWLASQIIWFVDNNWEWHYGIEWYFNDTLKWSRWTLVSRNDIKWRTIDPISLSNNSDLWWADIYTTIDRNVQKKVEEVLEAWVKKFRANKWMATVMDPKTWKIIAMANFPTYDSNNPWDVYELERVSYLKYVNPKVDLLWMPLFLKDDIAWKEFLYNSKKINLREIEREEFSSLWPVPYKYKNDFWPWVYQNDTISYLYEPWSIMKSITMAIWIDTWEINKYSTYEDKWFLNIDEFTIKNVAKECIWLHDYRHALDFSCNIWMIRIAQRIWKAIFYQYLTDFWFGAPTDITLEWEVYAKMDPYERWSKAKLFTNSYWLWINVTQLQMAAAYSVIANWWLYVKPRIIDYIKYPDWRIFNYKTEITHRVIKESTSKFMIDSLVESVEKWVAKTWRVEWYTVAWKTWTSVIPYKGQYKTENWPWTTNWSFAWFAPAEDPRFVMVITLVRPRWNTFWWWTSSEMFAEISKYLFDYYSIPQKIDMKSKK
jgi:cell division protein FtsI/penicillin-binding protein 2